MDINIALQNIGLSEKEVAVYTTLVSLGQSTPSHIAEACKVKRPTVYLVLEDLRKKGLVLKIPYVKKQLFTAKDPRELVAENESRVAAVKSALPQLMALATGVDKPKVLFFEGIDGLKQLLWYGLNHVQGRELCSFYGHVANMKPELLSLSHEYNEHLKSLDIATRGIAPKHPSLQEVRKQDKEYGRQVKEVPVEAYSSKMSIDIGDTFVKTISFQHMQGVIVVDEHITQVQRQIFEMVWNSVS